MASQDVIQQSIPTSPGLYRTTTTPILRTVNTFADEDHAPKGSDTLSPGNNIAFQPPTPISPSQPTPIVTDSSLLAGPSSHAHASASVPIPPPPNPRRHRSGALMSRVRANSSGTSFKTGGGFVASKSFGDLNMSMSMMSTDGDEDHGSEDEEESFRARSKERIGKRVVSEGHRRPSDEEDPSMWDNSARFYHHLHSRPPSRPASRPVSPSLSPVTRSHATSPTTSTSNSPIYVRRSLTLPQNPNAQPNMSVSLSPNHHFLQQHLPPPFHVDGHSPENHHASMVILTPTTQEWRDLKEIRRLESGGDSPVDSSSGSGTGSDDSRRSSLGDDASLRSSILFGKENGLRMSTRPGLRTTASVDYLPREMLHTPDPGSPVLIPPEEPTPERPVFKPVIIAPSPIMPEDATVPTAPDTPTREGHSLAERIINLDETELESSPEIDQDQPIAFPNHDNHAPGRFNSIGRRESLHAIRPVNGERPGVPRVKTKREQQREKLFKQLDEELESDAQMEPPSAGGVQEFGLGKGLASSADRIVFHGVSAEASLIEPKADLFDKTLSQPFIEESNAREARAIPPHVSPTQPMRPSPLHASPLNASTGLPTPETPNDNHPPILDLPPPEQSPTPPSDQSTGLDSIRSYARQFAPPHLPHVLRDGERSGTSTPSPPLSPRTGKAKSRRRDTNRMSLVAGRVVQPFAIPPSTSLPPDKSSPKLSPANPSLQSFSPFRSPALGPSKGLHAVPPLFSRFDSTVSIAPSTDAPSECGTPTSETAGGLGGRGIDDYVILKEAGKGAYGLVMRAKVKGAKGEPIGDEVIIKYIIKARILADCWKKHKQLGPIPVEMHVMDQLRHLLYNPPRRPHPWDPSRARPGTPVKQDSLETAPSTPIPDSPKSDSSGSVIGMFSPTQKYIASEIRHSPERGHPNICKLLDFFEDREFYYLVMPRFGTGVDLFDRVESEPDGLEPFEVRSLLGQLADAVRFLHSNGIIHRDIKDENVILDGTGKCQLIDFGSAAHWRPGKRWDTFSGTLHYASPEILRGEMYSGKEQDVWALGVVGYVLLVGETPFSDLPDEVLAGLLPDSSAEEALSARCGGDHIDEGKEEDEGGRLEDAADWVRRCLEMEPAERPSAEMLCQHRYIRGEGGWTGKKGWLAAGWK